MKNHERGMSLAEVLVSLAIVSVIVVFSARLLTAAYQGTRNNLNKQFAVQKAMSMLEELKALIQVESTATVLDSFDDGTVTQPILTTQAGVTDPAAPVSGNRNMGGKWLFERRITVQKMPGASDLRLVNVKVFINEAGGQRLLAEVASVLTTIGQNAPPTQVYDLYLIAIENVPGWWVYMQNIVTFVDNSMGALETRHAGLQFRRHWIRKLSYGRDPYYTPFVNATADAAQPIDSVYFYPGLLPAGSAVSNYYPPDYFKGRIKVDAVLKNNAGVPYSLADQYNHGMRYEDERALFDLRVAAGLEPADAPTLRLLLDDMYMHPARYTNAILINLHGELLPFPPVRNYSDPAKDPSKYPDVRVVTHPEYLRRNNAQDLNLRVYAYQNNGGAGAVPDWLGKGSSLTPITVVLRNIQWSPGGAYIKAIPGGVDFDGDGKADPYPSPSDPLTGSSIPAGAAAPTHMWWSSQILGNDTIIRLYNTPLKTPCVKVGTVDCAGGLDGSKRLYDMQYIPSPVEDLPIDATAVAFAKNLTAPGTGAKNTARWIINIPGFLLPQNAVIAVETRIGDDFTAGTSLPPPDALSNFSRTFVYRGDDVWAWGDATSDPNVPLTERFQFLGDPRHCPYADLKMAHDSSGLVQSDPLGMGYNRYFDDFDDSTSGDRKGDWPGWSYSAGGSWYGIKNNTSDNTNDNDGWKTPVVWSEPVGYLEVDVPRMFQVLRSALLRTHAVYTTMTGFSYYYIGLGNEIGYDTANGFPKSLQISNKPFTGATDTRQEDSITDADIDNKWQSGVKLIAENSTNWWGMAWLGELYPDSAYGTWKTTGNLPTGTTQGTFARKLREDITAGLPAGTTFIRTVRRTKEAGSTTFFWSGAPNSTFHHAYKDNTDGTLDADGTVVANSYKMPLPGTIANSRPFDINVNDANLNPESFLQSAYGAATTLATEARFYKHNKDTLQGSSLLSMHGDAGNTAFIVVNGLSPTGESGTGFIANWSFLSLVQSFMESGLTKFNGVSDPARVRELPRVVLTSPDDSVDINDPSTLDVKWNATWRRWDGAAYTPSYPAGFTEDTTIRFAVIYSRDNGKTWRYMKDESAATPGKRPANAALLQTTTTYSWSVPAASFPKGNYVIRVEAYRDAIPLHYAFHQYRAFIKRP